MKKLTMRRVIVTAIILAIFFVILGLTKSSTIAVMAVLIVASLGAASVGADAGFIDMLPALAIAVGFVCVLVFAILSLPASTNTANAIATGCSAGLCTCGVDIATPIKLKGISFIVGLLCMILQFLAIFVTIAIFTVQ